MKSLIVYFSHSGTTRRLAELIAKETGGDLLELVPKIAYPRDYSTVVAQAKRELQSGYRPVLKTAFPDLSAYDMVFVGTPNWWSSPAPPVLTFLEQAGQSGVQIAPFCTHGGGGSGHIRRDMEKASHGAVLLPELSVYGDSGRAALLSKTMNEPNSRKGASHMENNLTYTKNGDYLIPDLKLEETKPLGRYGRMRRDYLKEHRPVLFNAMMVNGKLYPHLNEIEQTMNRRLEQMMPELMQAAGVTEELKARDPMTWVGLMNNCKAQAEEILLTELIYS